MCVFREPGGVGLGRPDTGGVSQRTQSPESGNRDTKQTGESATRHGRRPWAVGRRRRANVKSQKNIKPILRLPKTYQPRRPNTYLLVWIVQWRMCARPSLGRRTVYQVPAPEMPPMTTSFEGSYSAVSPYGATAISKRPSSRYFLELQRIIQPEPGVSITVW